MPEQVTRSDEDGGNPPEGAPPGSGLPKLLKALRAKPDLGQLGVGVLIAALGFAAVEQVQLEEEDLLGSARRSDLIEIWSTLQNQGDRLAEQARELRADRRELLSSEESEQAALEQAQQRQQELGLLAGTVPAEGPGVVIRVPEIRSASDLVSAVQELRVAGAEAIAIEDSTGQEVRVGVDTYFVDVEGTDPVVNVGSVQFALPLQISAIGDPGALAGVSLFLGEIAEDWTITQRESLSIDAVREAPENKYIQPAPDDE